jgi:hypothetical protein
MNREEIERKSYIIYEEFYRQVNAYDDYVFEPWKVLNMRSMMTNYIDWLDKRFATENIKTGLVRIDLEFLVKFFMYGFNYWIWKINDTNKEYEGKYPHGHKSIKVGWVLGKEALKRFDRNEAKFDEMKWAREITKAETSVLHDLKAVSADNAQAFIELYLSGENEQEEFEKEQFYNTTEGLIWCKANTSLYNHKSKFCKGCNNRTRCKDLLKEQFPNLYKQRGYNGR